MRSALLLALAGCAHHTPAPAPSPHDVAAGLSLVSIGLRASSVFADDAAACTALAVSSGVVQSASDYLAAGGSVLPETRIDFADCGKLPPATDASGVPSLVAASLGPVRHLLASAAKDAPCELQHGLDAVAVRLALVAQIVANELTAPDGVEIVPAVPVEECP